MMTAKEDTRAEIQEEAKIITKPEENDENDIVELIKAILMAAVIALTIRTFIFEPFNIPSGSLLPTLQVGDYLFVEKYSYGYSRFSFPLSIIPFKGRYFESTPERGDIAVFRQPKELNVDYIKRIIGLPGDRIQVKEGILFINEKPVTRDFKGAENVGDAGYYKMYNRYVETLPNGLKHFIYEISDEESLDDTVVYTVPAGYYFAMGDNRDSSQDSRVLDKVGFVPAENLIGRAWFIFYSVESLGEVCIPEDDGKLAAIKTLGCKLIEYPKAIRYSRLLKNVNKM
jgi:signal peptidase I